MLSERRRHQYLDALGIPSWLPRAPLPGARPSGDWVWRFRHGEVPVDEGDFFDDDVADAPRAPADSPPAPRPPSGAGRAALLDSLGAATEARKPPPPAVPEPVATPEPAVTQPAVAEPAPESPPPLAPQEVPEFKLAFLQFGDALLIDSLPPQSRGGLTSAHQRLATALARALGVAAAQPPSFQLLPWPAFTSRSLDQGWSQAEAAVQRKLERLLEGTRPRFLLLLGEAAAQLVLRSREPGDGMRGLIFRPRSNLPALASASLTEMLQVPGCKAEVWRDLQPLLRQLADD